MAQGSLRRAHRRQAPAMPRLGRHFGSAQQRPRPGPTDQGD